MYSSFPPGFSEDSVDSLNMLAAANVYTSPY